jgi:hypothetical protein
VKLWEAQGEVVELGLVVPYEMPRVLEHRVTGISLLEEYTVDLNDLTLIHLGSPAQTRLRHYNPGCCPGPRPERWNALVYNVDTD